MARYIDADRLIERLKASPIFQDFNTDGYFIRDMVIDLVECQQITDVVPRAEGERLQHILDSYALQYGTVKDQQSVIVKVKSEMLSEFLRMVENVCKYEERLSYEKIKDGIKRQIAMKGGAE